MVAKKVILSIFKEENTMSQTSGENSGSNHVRFPQMMPEMSSAPTYSALSELMRAVILRVVDDFNAGAELQREALEYLNNDDEEYIFSFYSICSHFGLDPKKTREYIIHPRHRIATRRRAS